MPCLPCPICRLTFSIATCLKRDWRPSAVKNSCANQLAGPEPNCRVQPPGEYWFLVLSHGLRTHIQPRGPLSQTSRNQPSHKKTTGLLYASTPVHQHPPQWIPPQKEGENIFHDDMKIITKALSLHKPPPRNLSNRITRIIQPLM
eukprot:1160589-Pelagomonas_calceolata.AAC.3